MSKLERLQKIIAGAGIAARRKAEAMILEGRVSVNGQVVTERGTKADPERDSIRVDGKLIRQPPSRLYILLNKPRRVICTVSDPQGRTKVTDLVRVRGRVYPVGRLDYDTEGLILLTNDGAFARIIGGAGERFPKVYDVKVKPVPSEGALERLRAGIRLSDGLRLARCRIRRRREVNSAWLEVTLTEGRNRQIRQMFSEIGCRVSKLRRRRIGFLSDGNLPTGSYRMLTSEEVAMVYRLGSHTPRQRRAKGRHERTKEGRRRNEAQFLRRPASASARTDG